MQNNKLPFKLNVHYEKLEFDLEVIKDRLVGYDSYKYLKEVAIFNIPIKKIELIFYWDVLTAILLEFEKTEIEKVCKMEMEGFSRFNNYFIKTNNNIDSLKLRSSLGQVKRCNKRK